MSDLYKITNGKRVKLTAKQVQDRRARELLNQPTKQDKKKALRAIRDKNLNESTVTYNGSEFQTRPCDDINFEKAIKYIGNGSIIWTLADDTELAVNKQDLEEVYRLGELQGLAIDKAYRDAVRGL